MFPRTIFLDDFGKEPSLLLSRNKGKKNRLNQCKNKSFQFSNDDGNTENPFTEEDHFDFV